VRAPGRASVAALAAGLSVAGCGGVTAASGPAPARAPARRPDPTPSAQATVAAFARAYINWSARTVSRRLKELAVASVGQARSAMALEAAQTRGDTQLRAGGIANRGSVEAVTALAGAAGRHAVRYVVVTRESTTATATSAYRGLAPAWHVTIATVRLVRAPRPRWVLSGWQPES
jgi:hypothetical protein